jgi:hypothetical protein
MKGFLSFPTREREREREEMEKKVRTFGAIKGRECSNNKKE